MLPHREGDENALASSVAVDMVFRWGHNDQFLVLAV
jgi:hypothetical protein